jgi:hypothetical protein
MLEIHDLAEFDALIERTGSLSGVVVQGVDLSSRSREIAGTSCSGATFLGCRLSPDALAHLVVGGAVVFPELTGLPFDPYRPQLYGHGELLTGWVPGRPSSFDRDALDSRIYAWRRVNLAVKTLQCSTRLHSASMIIRSMTRSPSTSLTTRTSWR